MCLINCYLPTRKTDSDYNYLESLDVLHNFFNNYSRTHNVVICGDMNGTLLDSRNNSHDKLLKEFVKEHDMKDLHGNCKDHTFHSHSGAGSSQIDYVLIHELRETDTGTSLHYQACEIQEVNPTNFSAHVPVFMTLEGNKHEWTKKTRVEQGQRILWDKADICMFQEVFQRSMNSKIDPVTANNEALDAHCYTEWIHTSLRNAVKEAVPTKPIKVHGPKWKASPAMSELMKKSKIAHAKWRSEDRPDSQHELYKEMKSAKKKCRQQLRHEHAETRQQFYEDIMENASTDMFYKLIRRNRQSAKSESCSFRVNDQTVSDTEEQRSKLAEYYEDLAMPKASCDFDQAYNEDCEENLEIILNVCRQDNDFENISPEEIRKAITLLNTGKSADEYGLVAEHFKYAGDRVLPYIAKLFNACVREGVLPGQFKTGIITPIPKKDKDATLLDNYRGITVTAVMGKIFEYTMLHRIEDKVRSTQSDLQFGFTKGLSPIMATLLITEMSCNAKAMDKPLYLVFRDVKKAFDVVNHSILFNKLYHLGINGNILRVLVDLYTNLVSKIKWKGGYSNAFNVRQGVRQGGILSTHLYKCYIGDIMKQLADMDLGYSIGSIYCGCVTCADDMVLATDNSYDLQAMLNVSKEDADKHHYVIHPDKTVMIKKTNAKQRKDELINQWNLGEKQLIEQREATHLGVIRASQKENQLNIQKRISVSRRTLYALIPCGMHGSNGLSPKISYKIYQSYVLPRLLYGTEILPLTNTQLNELERFHINTIRNIQALPQRTPKCIAYLLIGATPIIAEYHKRQLALLGNILRCDNNCIRDLLLRQSAMCESRIASSSDWDCAIHVWFTNHIRAEREVDQRSLEAQSKKCCCRSLESDT